MSTKFLSPGWRMPRNANQSKQSNYSLQPPDINAKINISNPANAGITNSISLWLKRTSPSSVTQAYTINNAYGMWMNNTTLYIAYGGSILTISTSLGSIGRDALNSTDWVHWVLIREATATSGSQNFKLYANTNLVYSTNSYNLGTNDTVVSQVIRKLNNTDSINSFSIYNYALSPSQVTTLYGNSTNGPGNPMALPSTPIAYYPLGTSAYNGEYLAENNAIGDYVFDFPSGNYVNLGSPSSLQITGSLTLSSWVKYTSGSSGNKMIISKSNGTNESYFLSLLGNHVRFSIFTGNSGDSPDYFEIYADQEPELVQDTWYHIVGVFESGVELRAYINGVPVIDSDIPKSTSRTAINVNNIDVTIGMFSNGSQYPFLGEISNSQIWDTALTNAEVETLYNYGSPIQTLANIPQNSNLKAWYKLDASEVYNSTTTEWSIDNNQNPSAYSSSLDFDGNDKITIANTSNVFDFGTNDFTISLWCKGDGVAANQYIIGSTDNSFRIGRHASVPATGKGGARFRIGSSSNTITAATTNIDDGNWHNVVIKRESGGVSIFTDGQAQQLRLDNGTDVSTPYTMNDSIVVGSNLFIGAYNASAEFWIGKLSNVQIFNTALSQLDVTSLYNNGTPLYNMSSFTSLVSWWKLNNTTTGIQDAKGSNNGTNNGATEYTGFVNKLVGDSSGMSQANLVQSDLQTVAPYSKYALNFDSASSDYINCGSLSLNSNTGTVSAWIKTSYTSDFQIITAIDSQLQYRVLSTGEIRLILYHGGSFTTLNSTATVNDGNWHNVTFTYSSSGIKIYIDGFLNVSNTVNVTPLTTATGNFLFGARSISGTLSKYFNGKLSNASIWNTALTSAQVTEIYNEGLPSNLNSHSAYSNLVSWWQLGENSSFDGNDWIVADEKGTNNGTSTGMPVGALTNGVGTTANGVSSGMSEGNLIGDAPYSTANALSTNMVVTSRVTGSGNTP